MEERALHDPAAFRAALLRVPPPARDVWLDAVLGLHEIPDDGPDLPRGCVPYIPCPVDALLRIIDQADVRASDVFVDVGSGVGRATAFAHLLTGARAIGIEIQPPLVEAARDLATRLSLPRVEHVCGDAALLANELSVGTVFLLYCPFGGERLARVLAELERLARARPIRIGCVQMTLPSCPWWTAESEQPGEVAIYRSSPKAARVSTRP